MGMMIKLFGSALGVFISLAILTGVAYPLVITGMAQSLFPRQANGSLIYHEQQPVASALLAQAFQDPRYFWPRPSAANYDAMSSGGSNDGPTHPQRRIHEQQRLQFWLASSHASGQPPRSLLQASASGLDPDVSLEAIRYQLPRVARARGMTEASLWAMVKPWTESAHWYAAPEPQVNIMLLNAALPR
jgi:K+-transporting ATPase ATPase C chain